ncbi:immunoglobulin kappa light chain-like [Pimephales promelas]|uniref:immunoglobulin kappa light chain-like n=1 Tax=Pimephales promelas TaxID=90988 RepID=UPI001955C694|nr:immunoglobulin kappa light chain-like [Pimephales promelas]
MIKPVWSYCDKMYQHFCILLLFLSKCSSDNTDVVAQNHLKIVQAGDSVNFTCIFSGESRHSVVWVKQRVGEKPLPIVSSYQGLPADFEKGFDNTRFYVSNEKSSFNLSITNTEESDTGTYYCVKYLYNRFSFGEGTDLIVKNGQLSVDSEHQRAETDPDHPEESAAALQCAVVTQSCAGEHNVYWFRHQSGESPPGIIYTQDRRNAQCERRSDGNSTTHKCVYNLPKKKLSHSDAGIYYCAVAACGQILFGEGRTVDSPRPDTAWSTIALFLAASNSLSVIVIIILCSQMCKHQQKDGIPYIVLDKSMADDTSTTVKYTMYHKRIYLQKASGIKLAEHKFDFHLIYHAFSSYLKEVHL